MTFSSATSFELGGRTQCDLRSREPLADEVVRIAVQPDRESARCEGSERLARGSGEHELDRLRVGAVLSEALRDLVAEHRADSAIRVLDSDVDADALA